MEPPLGGLNKVRTWSKQDLFTNLSVIGKKFEKNLSKFWILFWNNQGTTGIWFKLWSSYLVYSNPWLKLLTSSTYIQNPTHLLSHWCCNLSVISSTALGEIFSYFLLFFFLFVMSIANWASIMRQIFPSHKWDGAFSSQPDVLPFMNCSESKGHNFGSVFPMGSWHG